MIEEAKKKLTGHLDQPTKPLIRLRITYNEEDQMFNTIRFGQQYKDVVANPSDLILFKKFVQRNKQEKQHLDIKALGDALAQVCNFWYLGALTNHYRFNRHLRPVQHELRTS